MKNEVTQSIKGEAQVTNVIGVNVQRGGQESVPTDATSRELSGRLDELLAALDDARQKRTIDDKSASVIERQVAEARTSLPITDQDRQGAFVRTMKMTKGLVEGLADLTTKVVAAISAAEGLM